MGTARPQGAAIYCRVSTAGQEDGTSLDTQEAACRRYAVEHGYAVAEAHVYREVHTGSELWERPRLTALREALRRGEVGAVVAYAVDRLSREQAHLYILDDEAERAGAALLFVTEEFDKTPIGKLVRSVKGFAAEIEREKIKERTLRGKRAGLERGRPLSGSKALYGYQWRPDKSGYDPNPATAPVVQRLFADYLAGRSLRGLGAALAAEGIPSPTGCATWGPTSIKNLLSHPAYAGEARGWRWQFERKPGGGYTRRERAIEEQVILPAAAVPPLVDGATFRAVQQLLADNKTQRAGRPPVLALEAALLRRGFARCGYCGSGLAVRPDRKKNGTISALYVCSGNARDRHGCPTFGITAAKLDREVWDYLIDRITRPEVLTAEWRPQQRDDPTAADLASLDRSLAELSRQQVVTANAVATLEDVDAAAPLLVKLQALAGQKRALEADRGRLVARRAAWQEARDRLDQAAAWCRALATKAATANYEQRRALLGLMEVRVRVYASDHDPRYAGEAWIPTYSAGTGEPEWRRELFTSSAECGDAAPGPRGPTPRGRAPGTAGRRGSRRAGGRVRACRGGTRRRRSGAAPR